MDVARPFVLVEPLSGNTSLLVKVERIHLVKRSPYQEIAVADTTDYGRALVLDGLIQSTYADEPYYHESLVHPALTAHPAPQDVLILGGGEGATLREVLKHPVRRAVMVDIDGEVVEAARQWLPQMHAGAFDDPRARVVIDDGLRYVEEAARRGERFDVVILDLTDPYGPEIGRRLYSADFYRRVRDILRPDGIAVTQAGSSFYFPKVYREVEANVASAFPITVGYNLWIPSFGYAVNFVLGSLAHDPRALAAEEVDRRLAQRGVRTKFYGGRAHVALMNFPIYARLDS